MIIYFIKTVSCEETRQLKQRFDRVQHESFPQKMFHQKQELNVILPHKIALKMIFSALGFVKLMAI